MKHSQTDSGGSVVGISAFGLILDGRVTGELAPDDVVRVRRGENLCRLISVGETDFYAAFRTKFNFRIRPDSEPTRVPESIGSSRDASK